MTLAGRHGIKRLRFGSIDTDLVYDGVGSISIRSNKPYELKLVLPGGVQKIAVKAGEQTVSVRR
jgi:hypothetical protein